MHNSYKCLVNKCIYVFLFLQLIQSNMSHLKLSAMLERINTRSTVCPETYQYFGIDPSGTDSSLPHFLGNHPCYLHT